MSFRLITRRAPRGAMRGHGWPRVAKRPVAALKRPTGGPRRPQQSPGAPRWLQNKCSNAHSAMPREAKQGHSQQ